MARFRRLKSPFRVTPVKAEEAAARRRRRVLIGLVATMSILVSLATLSAPWQLADLRAYDYLSTIAPPDLPGGGPIIVAIDEPSLAEIALQWPWPRSLHGELVNALREAGAGPIGLDIIFAEASTAQEDGALAAALGPDVVLAGDYTVIETPQAEQAIRVEPVSELAQTGAATGIASITLDRDGIMRRVPPYEDGFALQLVRLGGHALDLPPSGRLLRVFGPSRTYPTVSYYQALDPEAFLPEGYFDGRPVIVGLSLQNAPAVGGGAAGADAYPTSFTLRSSRLVAGAEIQATIHDNLAHRLFVRPLAWPAAFAATLIAGLAAGLAVWRGTGWRTLFIVGAAIAATLLMSFLLIEFGRVFFAPVAPITALVLVSAGQTLYDYAQERRTRLHITRAFSQYLAPALVERLARDPGQLKLGGERRTITVLFCDVRGFTTIAEQMKDTPDALTTLVNRLLTPLSDVVLASGGTIDKYIGDCIMAFWNAPLDDADHAFNGVNSALSMLAAMDALNAELKAEAGYDEPPVLRIGIGVNTGEAIVGNMGSERRFDYSALGDAVNYASRLESASKSYGVPLLIGEATATIVAERFQLAEIDRIAVKGRSAVAPIFTVARLLEKRNGADYAASS